LAVLPTAACGQNQGTATDTVSRSEFEELKSQISKNAKTVESLANMMQSLTRQVGTGNGRMDFSQPAVSPEVDQEMAIESDSRESRCCRELRREVYWLKQKVYGELEPELETVGNLARNHGRRLEQMTRLGSDSEYFPYTNAQNQAAKDHFESAVRETAPQKGDLVIRNLMPQTQWVRVNRGEWKRMWPGRVLRFKPPRGTVSTQLRGQDPDYWTIGAPDYFQSLDIRERDTMAMNYEAFDAESYASIE
jgi:hypothetical protein